MSLPSGFDWSGGAQRFGDTVYEPYWYQPSGEGDTGGGLDFITAYDLNTGRYHNIAVNPGRTPGGVGVADVSRFRNLKNLAPAPTPAPPPPAPAPAPLPYADLQNQIADYWNKAGIGYDIKGTNRAAELAEILYRNQIQNLSDLGKFSVKQTPYEESGYSYSGEGDPGTFYTTTRNKAQLSRDGQLLGRLPGVGKGESQTLDFLPEQAANRFTLASSSAGTRGGVNYDLIIDDNGNIQGLVPQWEASDNFAGLLPVLGLLAAPFTGGLSAALGGGVATLGSTIAANALIQGGLGGLGSLASGGDFLEGALKGGVTGAFTAGIGSVVNPLASSIGADVLNATDSKFLSDIVSGAVKGVPGALMSGDASNLLTGAVTGAVGSQIGDELGLTPQQSQVATNIASKLLQGGDLSLSDIVKIGTSFAPGPAMPGTTGNEITEGFFAPGGEGYYEGTTIPDSDVLPPDQGIASLLPGTQNTPYVSTGNEGEGSDEEFYRRLSADTLLETGQDTLLDTLLETGQDTLPSGAVATRAQAAEAENLDAVLASLAPTPEPLPRGSDDIDSQLNEWVQQFVPTAPAGSARRDSSFGGNRRREFVEPVSSAEEEAQAETPGQTGYMPDFARAPVGPVQPENVYEEINRLMAQYANEGYGSNDADMGYGGGDSSFSEQLTAALTPAPSPALISSDESVVTAPVVTEPVQDTLLDTLLGTGQDTLLGTGQDTLVGTGQEDTLLDTLLGTGQDTLDTLLETILGTGEDTLIGTGEDTLVGTDQNSESLFSEFDNPLLTDDAYEDIENLLIRYSDAGGPPSTNMEPGELNKFLEANIDDPDTIDKIMQDYYPELYSTTPDQRITVTGEREGVTVPDVLTEVPDRTPGSPTDTTPQPPVLDDDRTVAPTPAPSPAPTPGPSPSPSPAPRPAPRPSVAPTPRSSEAQLTRYDPVLAQVDPYDLDRLFSIGRQGGMTIEDLLKIISGETTRRRS